MLRRAFPNGTSEYRELVEHELEATRKMTPLMRQLAPHVQRLPPEELAARLRRAMLERPT